MAQLPPRTPQEEDERYNPANELYEREFNAGKPGSGYVDSGIDQAEAFANDPGNAVREQEEAAASNQMNYVGGGKKTMSSATSGSPAKAFKILRRGSPVVLVTGIILGFVALVFGSLSLAPVHLYQNFMEKFDTNNTSYTIRTNKVLVAKLVNDGTDGSCDIIKIRCRFSRPSNNMLRELDKAGINAIDKNGNLANRAGLWPNSRPVKFEVPDGHGGTKTVDIKNFKAELANDAAFRSAFHNGLKTRLQTFSDSVFKKVATRYGFTKQDTTAGAQNEDDVNKTVRDQTSGRGNETDADGNTVRRSADEEEIKTQIGDEANAETGKLAKSGVGNAVGLAAGGVCLVADVPGIVQRTARAYQMAQLIRFASVFMTTVSVLKAGDATPQQTTALNNALTTTVNGKSALDSYGVRYALNGDTAKLDDNNYKNYVPGGAVTTALAGALLILDSQQKKDICSVAASPITGVAINAALAPETLGLGTLANVGIGVLGSLAIATLAPPIIGVVLDNIPPEAYQALLKTAFGDLSESITLDSQKNGGQGAGDKSNALGGMNYGDALASGSANMLGQLANTGGNVPLSVGDAVAYERQSSATNLAYAEEDRATLSPLDASSKNTAVGALTEKLLPLATKAASLSSFASSFTQLAGTSASNMLVGKTFAATDTADQFTQCDDPALTDADGNKTAAGPFCNVQYGIPTKYLDIDPQQVVDDLVTAGQIDPDTGEAVEGADPWQAASDVANTLGIPVGDPITNYADWLDTCTDGKSDQAANCQIKDVRTAEYALYTIDHRIQKNMDDQDTDPTTGDVEDTAPIPTTVPTTTCTQQQTGAFTNAYTSSNTNLRSYLANVPNKQAVSFRDGTFSFNDFQGTNGIAITGSGTPALLGAGIDSTIFQMTPGSSSKADQVPGGHGRDFLSAKTNQFTLLRVDKGSPLLCGFTLAGTNQKHLYNGLRLQGTTNAQVSAVKISNIPGDDDVPPGETFTINDSHTNRSVYNSVEIDGGNVGASGFGGNNSDNTTIVNSSVHDNKYGNGITFWQCNNVSITDTSSVDNKDYGVNFERVSGTATLTRINTKGNKSGDYRFVTDKSSAKITIVDPVYDGSKIKIKVNAKYLSGENQKRSDIKVIIGGVDKTDEVVQWVS